jgi:hypothetical protein
MNTEDETILDNPFLGCALTAFLQVAREEGAMPDSEKTRRRAYELYEETLRDKNKVTLSRRLEL